MNPKNRTLIIVAAVVVVVLGLAGLAVVLAGGDDGDSNAEGDEPVPTYSADAQPTGTITFTGDPLPELESPVDDVAVGMAAPIVEGQDFDGNPMTTGGPTDGPTLLVYLAHWCPHCNAEIPEILELNSDDGIPADLNVIGVSTAVEAGAPNYPPHEWVVDKGWLWPTMADDADATSFVVNGGRGFPYMLLLDESGTVVSRISGEHSADELSEWLDTNLSAAA